MNRTVRAIVLALALLLIPTGVVIAPTIDPAPEATAGADHQMWAEWHLSHVSACCWGGLWWRSLTVYDPSTGIYWTDSYQYYHEPIDGYVTTHGPIQHHYSIEGWEHGRLGAPRNSPHFSHHGPTGPVFQQHFDWGIIRFVSNNACRCYYWGGTATTYIY